MSDYVKFQVKSSGQWLNIFEGGNTPGKYACQGYQADSDNFFWTIVSSSVPGWSLIQVKSSGQYLNWNGTIVCQNPLPNPAAPPDNFLWNMAAPDANGWSQIQLRSNLQYLNVLNNEMDNGKPVGLGENPTTPIFQWMQYNTVARPVTVTLNLLNCKEIFNLGSVTTITTLNKSNAGSYLSMTDNNIGHLEDPKDITSFETLLNPGSWVTWQPSKALGDNNVGFTPKITAITFEQGTGNNVLKDVSHNANDGTAQAQVEFTAIAPASGDNEAYSISFTLTDGTGTDKRFIIDPKIKINPSN